MGTLQLFLFIGLISFATAEPSPSLNFDYQYQVADDVYEQPVNLMTPKKTPHDKVNHEATEQPELPVEDWAQFDFSKFENYLNNYPKEDSTREHNRIKRRAKRRKGRGDRRKNRQRATTVQPEYEAKNSTSTKVPVARRGPTWGEVQIGRKRKSKKDKDSSNKKNYDTYESPQKDWESNYVEMPKDLYQAHLRPGVIFRIHMSEAILKMQYRNYGEDKDESVIEADVEYLRLTRKVINDEITKFEDLKWLISWFNNRSELIQEHMCNTRYYAVGIPPTMFTHPEEYMKRLCLFDSVYIDHIPYVVGEDSSLLAAVAPPVLHCDAATCTSVPFIDSVMFDERLARTNVRTLTRCQASCRAHCRNDPDCLKRCSDRCLRSD